MTARPISQAASAIAQTEDNGAVRRRLLDDLASAANRAPRLVTTAVAEESAEPSGETPLPASKRGRAAAAASRAKPAKGGRAKAAKASQAKETITATEVMAPETGNEPEALNAPLAPPAIAAMPEVVTAAPVVPARQRTSRAIALMAALALATVAAYFSVAGMAEIFPAIRSP
jgi:hypothetical protein